MNVQWCVCVYSISGLEINDIECGSKAIVQ